jgi:hypothetical protein
LAELRRRGVLRFLVDFEFDFSLNPHYFPAVPPGASMRWNSWRWLHLQTAAMTTGKTVGTQARVSVCLKEQPVFPFSPSALQASLQTSIIQVRNRTTGVAMSQIRQSDVKNHLSPRFRTKIHLCDPVSQPDATGFSVPELDAIQATPPTFAQDFVAEHSLSGAAIAPADPVTGSIRLHVHTASKSTQA